MIFKIITLFLAFIAILGLFGQWRLGAKGLNARGKCPKCHGKSGAKCPCQRRK